MKTPIDLLQDFLMNWSREFGRTSGQVVGVLLSEKAWDRTWREVQANCIHPWAYQPSGPFYVDFNHQFGEPVRLVGPGGQDWLKQESVKARLEDV